MKKSNILIIDDEEVIRDVLFRALSSNESLGIFAAKNGLKALTFLRKNTEIDTIFLDVRMPEMGAEEFLPELAKMGYGKNLHIVIMSGFLGNVRLEDLTIPRPGIKYSYLQKPFNRAEMNKVLQLT